MNAIRVDGLRKRYDGKIAVDGIAFSVEHGEIFGLLGPNGAGKTTTVEILEGLRDADEGIAEVLGSDMRKAASQVKQQIGVALQATSLMQNLTCTELLELFGSFYTSCLPPSNLLDRMDLQDKKDAQVKTLSGGQQQRLAVALALVNDPQIVFLDEPTTGLDPQARRSLWQVIEEMRKSGKTVFLTTHYMEEAERLCDRIAIMDHGKILEMDSPEGLVRSQFPEKALEFSAPEGTTPEAFAILPGVIRASEEGGNIVLYSDHIQKTLGSLLEMAEQSGFEIDDIHVRKATLEDVFLKLTGRRIRE